MSRSLPSTCAVRLAALKGSRLPYALAALLAVLCGTAEAQFDPTGWMWFTSVELSKNTPDGPAGIPLESGVIEKCRPDLRDIRLVTDTGSLVPFSITAAKDGREKSDPAPANVYRIQSKPDKWTDIWVDKSVKSLNRGVLIKTASKDFVRKVEIRGSDSTNESYVIRLDGLIADTHAALPIHHLAVFYPVNNFRYLHVRIMDENSPPLKLEGISCYPPASQPALSRPLAIRLLENHRDPSGKTTTVVGDLGESRLPLGELVVVSRMKEFAKSVTLSVSSTAADQSWEKVFEGVIFRLRKGDALAENLRIQVSPQPHRYFKLEASGGKQDAFVVDEVRAVGSTRLLVFNHHPGRGYRLYYGNPKADTPSLVGAPSQFDPISVAENAWRAVIGLPQQPVAPPKSRAAPTRLKEPSPSLLRKGIGVSMLLVGLVLLFTLMLRSRSTRRREASRLPRIMNTRH